MKNEIYIYTDKGSYVGGETIFGTVLVCIDKPINSKGMIIEIIGSEKAFWQYNHTESYTDSDGQQKSRTEIREHKDEKHFFKEKFKLIDYPGGFPIGRYSYPFQYRLPDSLPGVFCKKRKHGLKMTAKIQYKIKCIVEIPGFLTHDLKAKQHLVIHSQLDKLISAKHMIKESTVRTCCCIPRGPVRVEAWVDKNAYMSGEVSQVHVKVNNDSAVDVNHFNSKLLREITLEAHGHHQVFRDIVNISKNPGTPMHTSKASDINLPLTSKKGHPLQATTSSRLVKCRYDLMIEMDIPWAPDIELYTPVTIYAPQASGWLQWKPPSWIGEVQIQQVCSELAVSNDIALTMNQNASHAPVIPPQYDPYNQNQQSNKSEINYQQSPNRSEKTPLLG